MNKFKWVLIQFKTLFHLLKSPTFWKALPKMIFIDLFWQGLGATILFILMIPAMMFITKTYDKVNPMRGLFYKIQKRVKK